METSRWRGGKTEKDSEIGGIESSGMIHRRLNFANHNQQEPPQTEAHVHIAEKGACTVYLTMNQAF